MTDPEQYDPPWPLWGEVRIRVTLDCAFRAEDATDELGRRELFTVEDVENWLRGRLTPGIEGVGEIGSMEIVAKPEDWDVR